MRKLSRSIWSGVPWAVRPATTVQFSHDLGPPLPVSTHVFRKTRFFKLFVLLRFKGWGGLINWLMFEDMLGAFVALMFFALKGGRGVDG